MFVSLSDSPGEACFLVFSLEVRMGFEPTCNGFAIRCRPLPTGTDLPFPRGFRSSSRPATTPGEGRLQAVCIWGAFRSELRDGEVEGRQPSESELPRRPGGALVAIEHEARTVAGSVGDPAFGSSGSERQRHEGSAKVVRPQQHPPLLGDGKLGAVHAGELEAGAQPRREVATLADDRLGEHPRNLLCLFATKLAPCLERARYVLT